MTKDYPNVSPTLKTVTSLDSLITRYFHTTTLNISLTTADK